MAIGKTRGSKRQSGGSCSSTVTTAVLVTVCVFGVWILISNSTTSPPNTPYGDSSFLKSNRKIPIDTNTSVYEHIHSDHVVPHDDEQKPQDDDEPVHNGYKLDDDRDWLAEIEEEPQQEIVNINNNVVDDDDAQSLNDSDAGKQEAEEHQEEGKEEQDVETSTDSDIEEKASKNEEHDDKTKKNADQQSENVNQEDDIRDLEQETTDQDRKKGTENQPEDEQEQHEDGPIESHSVAAETQAHVESQEVRDVRNKMEQAKIEPIITNNITIPIKAGKSSVANGRVGGFIDSYKWSLCNVTTGADYMPCLDNGIKRRCRNEPPLCLVPLPNDYKTPISWRQSRDKIWLHNMPNKALANFKGNQNWIKVTGEFITFLKGALHYINFLQEVVPEIAWGKRTRVVLDVGCGVANFGGYLFDKEVLTMSFAPKDDQESQIQFALERGIPAISAVMGTQRLPFPSRVFDLVHCVRCKVPWHKDGGILLLEVNRLLRPGGYFVWSGTPVYGTLEEDVQIWKEMSALTVALCWELVTIKKDKPNAMGVAIYHKPDTNACYEVVKPHQPPICKPDDDPNFSWYVPLQTCAHMVPMGDTERGSHWPEDWPARVQKPPYWLNKTQMGIDGKPAPRDFIQDYEYWKQVIKKTYTRNLGIKWSNVRNVMDMRAGYGGFAAALKDLKLWVLNVVNVDSSSPDTLPMIFERGLVGIYHDWCESFSTYPRTYDLLHADHLFSKVKERCRIKGLMAEIDRILRPGGVLIARDEASMITELEKHLRSLDWEVKLDGKRVISGRKSLWRPSTYAGVALESLAKGNKKIPSKRKGGSICIQYNHKSKRIQSESFNSQVTLNHEAQVMFSDCLANNFGSNATTGCHESIQNDSMNMKTCALIPEDELMLESTIEARASLEALAKGNEQIPNKRKGRSICKQYYRKKRRSVQSESFNSHVTLNHEAQVDDAMSSGSLANNFGSNATTGCHESIQNGYSNGPMRGDGLCKVNENYCFLLTDNLMTFFDTGIEPNHDSHMHNGDSDDSSGVTEVEYPSLLSFSSKDYINCVLNTEETIDNIPDSQLLDSDEDDLEDCSFDGDLLDDCHCEDDSFDGDQQYVFLSEDDSFDDEQQDVCHCEDDEESISISHLDPVHLFEEETICILNTEDPEIPCNDDIFMLNHSSPSARPQSDTESVDLESSFTQSQMDGPNLSPKFDSATPHVDCTLISVSMGYDLSISDHNDSSDSDLFCYPDIEYAIPSPSVRPQTSMDSIDPTSCFTQSQMDGPGLSSEFESASPHLGCTLKSVSGDHNPSISNHNSDSDVPCSPEDPAVPSPTAIPQTAMNSIDFASCFTKSQMDGPGLSSEFESASPCVGCTLKSVSVDHSPSISDRNSDSDLPCFTEDPEISSPSVRPQTNTDSVDPTSSFSRSQIDGPDLSSDFESANTHVDCTLESVSMDHSTSLSDHNGDIDVHGFLDIINPEIRSASVRLQTALDSIDLTSCFTEDDPDIEDQQMSSPSATDFIDSASCFARSQMDGPDLSCEFDSAHPQVGKYVSVDHDPFIADHNNSDSDNDLPSFPDIDALICKLDYEYAQESWITNEVKRGTYERYKSSLNRLEQSSSQRAMPSLGAFAVFYSHQFKYYIKKTEVTIGRSTDDTEVDIDLRKETHANMISRQQATIKMENNGTFTLKNIGKGLILMSGISVAHGQVAALGSSCLLQIKGMDFVFEMNDRYVRWYLDNIVKKTQGKFTTFEWSVN
ncbi:uncharacterized protein LOC143536097 [Bidens hawaiensis]|uniref:uncharacterized protein LOC143536097 n=1 Tax=Bidens hawaiensis TaxID=980011 RepID=UPI00404A42B2